MTRKQQPKPDDPEQSKRFIDAAREVEATDDSARFDRAFHAVASQKKFPPAKES